MSGKTYTRINGCGITVSPIPKENNHSISTKWITVFFIPIIPLGFFYVIGLSGGYFSVVKRLPFKVVWEKLPLKNILSILVYPLLEGVFLLSLFLMAIFFIGYVHSLFG